MATYDELYNIVTGETDASTLRNRITVATAIKAQAVVVEPSPSSDRLAWAISALEAPQDAGLFNYVITANKSATVAAITGASDSTVQTNVDAAVDKIHP